MAAALAAAFPAHSEEAKPPVGTLEVGVGWVSDDNLRFGQYNGLIDEGAYLLLDADINRRNDATGTWLRLRGRNLGLDHREIRFENERQGDWGYFIDFSQTPRYSPYIVNTTLSGIETGTQLEGGTPARDVRLSTRRDALGVGFNKKFAGAWDAGLRFQHEEKTGTRLYGHHSVRFLVDPIDYQTDQIDATAGYNGERLQLIAGYYGTNFQNGIPSVATNGPGLTPIALPPGNQSHQAYLTGGYGFTPTTRATFKVAFGQITQDQQFFPVTTSLAGLPSNLDGKINTTLVQAGIASRPTQRLSLRADVRYEDRDDKTPIFVYTTPGTTHNGQNEPRSIRTIVGKLDATYALPAAFYLNAGIEQDNRKRNTSPVRIVSFREETDETSLRVGLRRSLSETLNGALTYIHSERSGSDWQTTTLTSTAVGSNIVHPLHLADRDRDKVRLALDWAPLDPLSVQLLAEYSQDEYSGRTLGPREGEASFISLDGSYALAQNWQLIAWVSYTDTKADQTSCNGAPTGTPPSIGFCPTGAGQGIWEARLRNTGEAIGAGIRGKPTGTLEVGADISWTNDVGEFKQSGLTGSVVTPAIPDVTYETLTLKLHGTYALTKQSGVRLLYVFDRFETDDWYWTVLGGAPFVYGDGTTVRQDPKQEVHFVGASYYYRF
jgi:MtrB/PioB family decaheme-associated outer membrane protein